MPAATSTVRARRDTMHTGCGTARGGDRNMVSEGSGGTHERRNGAGARIRGELAMRGPPAEKLDAGTSRGPHGVRRGGIDPGVSYARLPSPITMRLDGPRWRGDLAYRILQGQRWSPSAAWIVAIALATTSVAAGARAQDSLRSSPGRASGIAPRPVTRKDAIDSALARGIGASRARIDTVAALARATVARALPNPTLSASYSQSAPQLHATVDLPVDLPIFRGLRMRAAEAELAAARLGLRGTEATVRYEVELAYGGALAARERMRLSSLSARDADSLVRLVAEQRAAGDASDLDVQLATVTAGQLANAAAADSLTALGALLDLQLLMGLEAERVVVTLADSLAILLTDVAPSTADAMPGAPTPAVAAAEAVVRARELSLRLARRRSALAPSIQAGVEGRDPTGGPTGALLLLGVAVPLPLFDRYRGDIAMAAAGLSRSRVELAAARRESAAVLARARLGLAAARERVARDQALVAVVEAVTAKTLTGYREGAFGIPAVLAAQRSARDAYAQFAADVTALAAAAAAMRLASATP